MIISDDRMPYIRTVLKSIMSKTDLKSSDIMITRDNTLVIISYETLLYIMHLDFVPVMFDICFKYTDIEELEENQCINNETIYYGMMNYYNTYLDLQNAKPMFFISNLKSNEEFAELSSMKSAEGLKFLKLFQNETYFFVPVFSGFPALNKQDDVDIEMYNYSDRLWLTNMTVHKHKLKKSYNMIYKSLKLV